MLLAVVAVLALGFWSARQNTLDLLRDKSEATIQVVTDRIDQHLSPAAEQLSHLGRQLESGEIAESDEEVGNYLAGALAATPDIRSIVLIRADLRMVFALRREDGVDLTIVGRERVTGHSRGDGRGTGEIGALLGRARTP